MNLVNSNGVMPIFFLKSSSSLNMFLTICYRIIIYKRFYLIQPVGGIASLSDVGRYPQMAEPDNSIDGKEIGFIAAGAVSAALAGAGAGLYYSRRRNRN